MAATLFAASFAVFADYSYFGPRVLRSRHLTPWVARQPASIASIIIVMTSTLLSAGSGRNPAWDGPTPAASVKCLCVCVSVFLRAQGFFFVLQPLPSPRQPESCRAAELLDISCAYSLADEVAGSACFAHPGQLRRQISIRFGSYFCSLAAAAAWPVCAGGFKRLKLRIRPYTRSHTEYLVLS